MPESISLIPIQPERSKEDLKILEAKILEQKPFILAMCKKTLIGKNQGRYLDRAGDIANEAVFNAYKKADQFKGESGLQTWLGRITINKTLEFLRKMEKAPSESTISLDDADDFKNINPRIDTGLDPEESLIKKEQERMLEEAIEAVLNPKEKEVIKLFLSDKEQEESARELGISLAAFKSILTRARAKLAQYVKSKQN